jgi:hypothetical protein
MRAEPWVETVSRAKERALELCHECCRIGESASWSMGRRNKSWSSPARYEKLLSSGSETYPGCVTDSKSSLKVSVMEVTRSMREIGRLGPH